MTLHITVRAALWACAAFGLASPAQAQHCNGNTSVGTDIAVLNTANGAGVVNHFLGACQADAQTLTDSALTSDASIASTTVAAYGRLAATADVISVPTPQHGVLASSGSSLGDGYVARSIDVITAVTNTQLRFTTVFDYSGSFAGTVTATSAAFASIRLDGPTGETTFVDQRFAGPGGTTHQVFTTDILLPAGTTVHLQLSLGALADGSANGFVAQGSAHVDTRYTLGLQVLNAGGQVATGSGSSYLPAAPVPEPASGVLLAAGLLAMAWRRRAAASALALAVALPSAALAQAGTSVSLSGVVDYPDGVPGSTSQLVANFDSGLQASGYTANTLQRSASGVDGNGIRNTGGFYNDSLDAPLTMTVSNGAVYDFSGQLSVDAQASVGGACRSATCRPRPSATPPTRRTFSSTAPAPSPPSVPAAMTTAAWPRCPSRHRPRCWRWAWRRWRCAACAGPRRSRDG